MSHLWWARRDLRLADNPALLSAQHEGPATAVFAWTPANDTWTGRRRAHLARVLSSLAHDTGESLAVRSGSTPKVVAQAAREGDTPVVWAHREYSPAGIREQQAVAEALAAEDRELRLLGSPYAVAPGRVRKADAGSYQVFTPFADAWRAHGWRAPAPTADPGDFAPLDGTTDLDAIIVDGDADDPLESSPAWRESEIVSEMHDYLDELLEHYRDERDRPDLDSTSRLSVALAHGQIHPRTILELTGRIRHPSARVFENELAWREFHADTLAHQLHAQRSSLTPVLREQDWLTGEEADDALAAWAAGRTGFPLVDAGMRQVAQTGWMHNRVRMVVASFLIKDLRVPWQRGADHFRRVLLDYDHSQNQLNWQWVAGTGRDAAPFFRMFNPTTQLERFDPDQVYSARWIAELGSPEYPGPMVDHRSERETTLALYRQAKDAAVSR